ncbi:acyl carrier protein [Streptomyces sp. NPDC048594]|uniref:acyl carrier protein n=1 Tax=unclassified Streptomyces TaxID=2593676 RepID=UPI0033C9D764
MWDERFEYVLRGSLPYPDVDVEFRTDTDLRDLGLDSLGVVDLLAELEKIYRVNCMDLVLDAENLTRVGDLWQVVRRSREKQRDAAA